jgi:Flp pilus assembly protein TadG
MLLCGLAIDGGLLYLAKARLSRAVDGAALAAVGNFSRASDPVTNRDDVALIMRNFAVANFTDLSPIGGAVGGTGNPASGGTSSSYTLPNGQSGTQYTYTFNDATQDANGQYRRFVQVVLTTGSAGQIVSATCSARCPVQTYFIGYATYAIGGRGNVKIGGFSGVPSLYDLKVSSAAVATRNPRLIMVVIDRSASMLKPGGGAFGLPPAVVQFLNFFDTSSDNIGIVSFGSAARLEMPLTTNFLIAGTNNLIDAYETNATGGAEPGVDPESVSSRPEYDPNYATTGVRRMKFGGTTAADEGIRLAMEQLMANDGFNNPNVVKYLVLFTDGAWNATRTMCAAPAYTNRVFVTNTPDSTHVYVSNLIASTFVMTNGQWQVNYGGQQEAPWQNNPPYTTNGYDDNLLCMPTLSPTDQWTNAIDDTDYPFDFGPLAAEHLHDIWQSADGVNEPLGASHTFSAGNTMTVITNSWVGTNSSGANLYTQDFDVWLQPGAVAYLYASASATPVPFVSDYTKPQQHIYLKVPIGGHVDLVVPGYIADGVLFDGFDLPYPSSTSASYYPRYREDNYQQAYMWPDDTASIPNPQYSSAFSSTSIMRQLMFRNYVNLLTGYYVSRPDYPLGSGYEPLITDQYPPGAPRARDGLGEYYPGAAMYWPFDNVGVDTDSTYSLANPNSGRPYWARFGTFTQNMLSTSAAPQWAGELFYKSISGSGVSVESGTGSTAESSIMTSSDFQNGAPSWLTAWTGVSGIMTNEPAHDTNISPAPSVWRPVSYNGSQFAISGIGSVTPSGSSTGGYVTDGAGHYYKNAMAYSGRPTHFFDFSQAKWVSISNNHLTNQVLLPIGNWKASEYAWHARSAGVTIYTVGYGTLVTDAQQAFLAQIANATNTTAGGGSNISYNPGQPIGQQFYATNSAQISNDFYQVGQAINEALTQ